MRTVIQIGVPQRHDFDSLGASEDYEAYIEHVRGWLGAEFPGAEITMLRGGKTEAYVYEVDALGFRRVDDISADVRAALERAVESWEVSA